MLPMTSTARRFAVAAFVAAALPARLLAKDEVAPIDPRRVPVEASSAAGFAPPGWWLADSVTGDLDGDGRDDLVASLVEEERPAAGEAGYAPRARALVVALRGPEGTYLLAAVAPRLLACTLCNGMPGSPDGKGADLEISGGVLTVEQEHGSRWAVYHTQRVRLDRRTREFALIGEDFVVVDRPGVDGVTDSRNHLTGRRIVERWRKDRDGILSRRVTQIPRSSVRIEEVDVERARMELDVGAE